MLSKREIFCKKKRFQKRLLNFIHYLFMFFCTYWKRFWQRLLGLNAAVLVFSGTTKRFRKCFLEWKKTASWSGGISTENSLFIIYLFCRFKRPVLVEKRFWNQAFASASWDDPFPVELDNIFFCMQAYTVLLLCAKFCGLICDVFLAVSRSAALIISKRAQGMWKAPETVEIWKFSSRRCKFKALLLQTKQWIFVLLDWKCISITYSVKKFNWVWDRFAIFIFLLFLPRHMEVKKYSSYFNFHSSLKLAIYNMKGLGSFYN